MLCDLHLNISFSQWIEVECFRMLSLEKSHLVTQITDLIVQSVNLRHMDTTKITADTVLAGSGLALDSIDILEIVVAVEQRFGVKIKDTDDGKKIFHTIGTIADFVHAYQN